MRCLIIKSMKPTLGLQISRNADTWLCWGWGFSPSFPRGKSSDFPVPIYPIFKGLSSHCLHRKRKYSNYTNISLLKYRKYLFFRKTLIRLCSWTTTPFWNFWIRLNDTWQNLCYSVSSRKTYSKKWWLTYLSNRFIQKITFKMKWR